MSKQPHSTPAEIKPTASQSMPIVPWNPLWALVFVVVMYFATQIIGGLVISLYAALRHWDTVTTQNWLTDSVIGQFSYVLIAEALTILGVIYFLKYYKRTLRFIGLKRPRFKDLGIGLLAYPVYFISFAVLLLTAAHFIPGLNVNQEQEIGFKGVQGTLELTLTFISLVILPPLTEEIMVRGFLFGSLRKYLKLGGAALLTSLIFAAAHLPEGGAAGPLYIAAIDTFMLSLILCWLREKTGSLWAGISLHALKNGVAFVSLFILASR
jgi:membrane protease YdiL (CAAX protease family)